MLIDTHCHLNFQAFEGAVDTVVRAAQDEGIGVFIVPGTDITTSEKALRIARQYNCVYAAVGIHPHHIFELDVSSQQTKVDLAQINKLLQDDKVVAVGEIGLDRHYYQNTKYSAYEISSEFMKNQKELLEQQIHLGLSHDKSVIFHNREAKDDFLSLLHEVWDTKLEKRSVFHCCEPDQDLLLFAKEHNMYIGIDGDVTFSQEKQDFIQTVPLEMLVLETDAPFLTPEPIRSQKTPDRRRPKNEPRYLPLIAEKVSELKQVNIEKLSEITTQNAQNLFRL